MKNVRKIIRISVSALSVCGMIYFFIPVFKDYFELTTLFAEAICLCALLLANCRSFFTKKGTRKKINMLYNAVIAIFVLFLCWLAFVSFKIFTVDYQAPPKDTTVIVLGARVYEDHVSLSLKNRLDTAYQYLVENSGAKCIVTGGQGGDEPRTEASAAMEYLEDKGISSGRILLEDKSTTTLENLRFSKEILAQNKMEATVVVVTQGFHQFRASSMARDEGYRVYSLKCKTDPILFPTYYSRELMAITKYYIDKIF